MKHVIELKVNGEFHEVAVDAHRTLLEVLRENLGLTGTKEGCDLGTCGTCTVLIDGKAELSCLALAVDSQKKEITTIEGLSQSGKLHPLQQNFVNLGAIQCGFCTPGMVMSAKAMLEENPQPTAEEAKRGISGNLCRCTGYSKIIKAIMATAGNTATIGDHNG
jgi:carbon-monoxide dehydrogenase small subunit